MRTYHMMILLGMILAVISIWLLVMIPLGIALLLTAASLLVILCGLMERRLST